MTEIEYLRARLDLLTQQLELLEKASDRQERYRDVYVSDSFRYRADTRALLSMIAELAEREGLSAERVEACFLERARFYHDALLQRAADKDQMIAALADDRRLEEVPTEKSFQPLFPPTNP